MNLIKLDITPIEINTNIKTIEKLDNIYIPISENTIPTVHKNSKVSIGTPIANENNKILFSTISGVVQEITEIETINGLNKAIKIENDFKEQKTIEPKNRRDLKEIKPEVLDKILKNNFNIDLNRIETLILNCIDDEPYVLTESTELYHNFENFLELLDTLSSVYELKRIMITVKENSSDNISELLNILGMYPNIELKTLPNFYLLGHEEFIKKYLNMEDNTYVIRATSFYRIYDLLKRNRLMSSKLVTISGNGIEDGSVIKVKIGAKLEEVLASFHFTNSETVVIANGLMKGKKVNPKNFIITEEVYSITIMKEEKRKKEEACIHCGACKNICPVNINPLELKKDKVKEKCIHCGLCSYICPCYIELMKEGRE